MNLYAENILEHFKNPHCKQTLQTCIVEHEEINHSCGDKLSLQLDIKDDTIINLGWDGTGCAISQAGMSILSEKLIGMKNDAVMKMNKQTILEMFGIPIGTRRMKCALLCLHTLKNTIRKSQGEETKGWLETVEYDKE